MHGYMMPSESARINWKTRFTWLHYSHAADAKKRADPVIYGLRAISIQKRGGELPLNCENDYPVKSDPYDFKSVLYF
jgi:hypothetical protein